MPTDRDDEFSHAPDEPSRSQLRREALAVFDLAEELVALSGAQLARLPLAEDLRALVIDSQRITQQGARKRQLQFLAKHMRKRADELPPIRAALDHDRDASRRDTGLLHRAEDWRERLIAGGDAALDALLAQHPGADRQHLRQLARRAATERAGGKPPSAARELFRVLRELHAETPVGNPDVRRG